MKKTYQGSCHCGRVRFSAAIDFAAAGTSRCNCSLCTKTRLWKVFVGPADLQVLQGDETLVDYRFGSQHVRHRFCGGCGVKLFGSGGEGDQAFVAINVAALDDAVPEDLLSGPLTLQDGRHDDWAHAPADVRLF